MHYLVISIAGLFVFNEEKKLIKHTAFKKDPEKIAQVLISKESPEIDKLKREFKDLVIEQPNKATKHFRQNFRKLALETKFVSNNQELNEIINQVAVVKTVKQISKMLSCSYYLI